MVKLPDPPAPVDDGYRKLAELVGQTVEVTEVEDLDGIPIVVIDDGRRFLCTGKWASEGATAIQGNIATSNAESVRVSVIETSKGHVGFANADDE